MGGVVFALLCRLRDPRDRLPDDFLVLRFDEAIPGIVVGRGSGNGEEVFGSGELSGRDFFFLSVSGGFEPLLGSVEVLGEFFTKILVVHRGAGLRFTAEVMPVDIRQACQDEVPLLLVEFLLEELLACLSGFTPVFAGALPELCRGIVLVGLLCGLPSAITLFVLWRTFPDTVLESLEVWEGFRAGTHGGEIFSESFLTGRGFIKEARDFLRPAIGAGRFCEIFERHASGFGGVLQAVAIDIEGEDGTYWTCSVRVLADQLKETLLCAFEVLTTPANVGPGQVADDDILEENIFRDGECASGVLCGGCGLGSADKGGVAILVVRIGGEVAAGFGLDFRGGFGRTNHGLDETPVNVIVTGSERFSE